MTARELIMKRLYVTTDGIEDVHDSISSVEDAMIEFAAFHVELALKEASKKALVELAPDWLRKEETIHPGQLVHLITIKVNADSILNSFSFEDIK